MSLFTAIGIVVVVVVAVALAVAACLFGTAYLIIIADRIPRPSKVCQRLFSWRR